MRWNTVLCHCWSVGVCYFKNDVNAIDVILKICTTGYVWQRWSNFRPVKKFDWAFHSRETVQYEETSNLAFKLKKNYLQSGRSNYLNLKGSNTIQQCWTNIYNHFFSPPWFFFASQMYLFIQSVMLCAGTLQSKADWSTRSLWRGCILWHRKRVFFCGIIKKSSLSITGLWWSFKI